LLSPFIEVPLFPRRFFLVFFFFFFFTISPSSRYFRLTHSLISLLSSFFRCLHFKCPLVSSHYLYILYFFSYTHFYIPKFIACAFCFLLLCFIRSFKIHFLHAARK
jgi:hypothetical protein